MHRLLIGTVLLAACATAPAPVEYDPRCFDHILPVGVEYPTPTNSLAELLPRPQINQYPKTSEPDSIVTVRRVGPYSDPEIQFSLIESSDGHVVAQIFVPDHCSIGDQMLALFLRDPHSTEQERLRAVSIKKTTVTESQAPEVRHLFRDFQRLRVSTHLFEGLILDARSYQVWVDTPLEHLELSTVTRQAALAAWADRAIAELSRH